MLAAGGAYMASRWRRSVGPVKTAILLGAYLGGFGASHPLAKRIGAWPSVIAVSGVSAAASYLLADRAAASAPR